MTVTEAKQIESSFYRLSIPDEEDIFSFTEAMEYLIRTTGEPRYMLQLGGLYYEQRHFKPALKYYELAAEAKDPEAYLCLGYIWYYGRTGAVDYEKAFRYYSLAADAGSVNGAYKLADMYKNGYSVEKDYGKYKEIIESLYPKVCNARYLNEPLPEIFTRLARIRAEQGKTEEAVSLYRKAEDFLAQRIRYNGFFGNLNTMQWLVDDLYRLCPFDAEDFGFYDLFYLLQSPCRVSFRYRGARCVVEVTEENGERCIRFGDRYFRNREDFFSKAAIGKELLTALYNDLYGFEVEEWKL